MPKSESKAKASKTPVTTKTRAESGARFDVGALRVALAKSAGVPKISRPDLAKLIGAHPNSIALWESGSKVGEKYLSKLKNLDERITKGEKIEIAPRKKGGRPKKAVPKKAAVAKTSKGRPGRPKRGARTGATVDVKALRTRLGASREVMAKLLGVSPGSILNWETPGKTVMTEKNLTKLRDLAAKAEAGQVALPERRKGGRPRKAVAAGAVVKRGPGRPRKATAITGAGPLLFANVASVQRGARESLIRFAVLLPGDKAARAVADVVVTPEALAQLGL